MLAVPMLFDILGLFLHEITLSLLGSCKAVLVDLWLSVRHAVYKTDTAEDDKEKSDASLGGLTHHLDLASVQSS